MILARGGFFRNTFSAGLSRYISGKTIPINKSLRRHKSLSGPNYKQVTFDKKSFGDMGKKRQFLAGASSAPQYSSRWFFDQSVVMIVFAITGSSTMFFVRRALRTFDIEGSWTEGPWSYRLSYTAITLPLYSLVLVTLGTLAGKAKFFKGVVVKMYSRILPKSVINKLSK